MKTHRTILALCLVAGAALLLIAWNPSANSFLTSQFSTPIGSVAIKDGAVLTNVTHYGNLTLVSSTNTSWFSNVVATGYMVASNGFYGDGSGLTGVVIGNTGTAGTYRSATFNAQGLETAGSNPTTFSGYAISDTSANLASAITDETGTGGLVFSNTPTLYNANLIGTTGGLLSSMVGSPTNSEAGNATVDFSKTESTTNAAGAIAFTALSNFNTTNYNWKIIHVLANGADRAITFAASWKTSGGTCTATNGTQKDLLVEAQIGVFTNVSWKSVY